MLVSVSVGQKNSHRPTDRHMTDSMTDVTWPTWLNLADVWPTHDRHWHKYVQSLLIIIKLPN
jgi:hypothetical protein